jgi:hypothetical protein
MHERGHCSGGCLLADAFGVSAASEWRAKKFGADDECGLYAYLPNLHRLEFQRRRFQIRRSLGPNASVNSGWQYNFMPAQKRPMIQSWPDALRGRDGEPFR